MIKLADAWDRAMQLYREGKYGSSEALLCEMIAERDEWWEACTALGSLYATVKANGRAITFLKRAIELNPRNMEAMANLAMVYRSLEKSDEAIEWSHRALQLAPNNPVTLSNLAGVFINAAAPLNALAWATRALAIAPDLPEAGNHRALALLELGRFEEGWAQYDSRFGVGQWHRRPYTCPQWKGERTELLAVSGEQGVGDEVMFLTCIKQLRELVGDIVLEVTPRLVRIVKNSFPDLHVYGTCEELLDQHVPTAWTHMGSVPRFIWPVVPNKYLKPTRTYPRAGRRRIGISWRGGTATTHERLRNFPIEQWQRLIADVPAEVISLQYGDRAAEAMQLGIPHDAAAIADLDTLCAMIKSCDLVVSVTNTAVHMAGALGVPCLSLVPSKPDWRCGLTGERMVWYDSVRMVRQRSGEDWSAVVDRARELIFLDYLKSKAAA